MVMKILASDPVSEQGLAVLRKEAEFQVDINTGLTEDQLVEIIAEYDALIVRSETKVTARIFEAAKKLKIVGRAGVGVDNIDLEAATKYGVIVVNAPDGNTIAAAELSVSLMMALARKVPQAHGSLVQGRWDRKKYTGVEMRNKTLGVIGFGRIGSAVAKRAQALEMKILAYDPFVTAERGKALGVEIVSLDEIYQHSDFITVHMPLTKESKHMINKDTLAKMKDGVRIVNCARGGIINEQDLHDAIVSKKVAGAALDVFEKEPCTDSPLFTLEEVVVTPHLGASTEEAQINVAIDVAEEIVIVLKGGMAKNAVNLPSIKPEVMASIQAYLPLAEKLGSFQAQILDGGLEKIEVEYSGELANLEVGAITTTILKGILDPILTEKVNFVNAVPLAQKRGIKVIEHKKAEFEDFTNLISVTLTTDKGTRIVGGSLFHNNDPRFVRFDDYHIDTVPEGNMLVALHIDKPKIIGRVGTLIGEHDINISSMQVGRKFVGGTAVMVLSIDGTVPEETMIELKKIDGIIDIKFVTL